LISKEKCRHEAAFFTSFPGCCLESNWAEPFRPLLTPSSFGGGAYWFLVPVAFPLALLFSLGRWVAARTCVIPRWPADVEAACAVEPNDPYLRDRNHLAAPGTVKKPEFMR